MSSTPSACAAGSVPADPELHAVRYAFEAAFQRFREASDDDAWMAELSNMLHHLYRLRELCCERHGRTAYYAIEKTTAQFRAAGAACWARGADTHRLFRVASSSLAPVYSDTYGAVYGELVWRPRTELPLAPDKDGRYRDYETELEDKAIADTLRAAFEAMAALL